MKKIPLFVVLALFLFGCADRNAFSKFDLQSDQELSEHSIESINITKNNKTIGLLSAIYLNAVYPNRYSSNEFFFVAIYMDKKQKMYNPVKLEDIQMSLYLNGTLPLKIKKLPKENKFHRLVRFKGDWYDYYLVAFKHQESNSLKLSIKGKGISSSAISYEKEF